jgi:hypothetical protein
LKNVPKAASGFLSGFLDLILFFFSSDVFPLSLDEGKIHQDDHVMIGLQNNYRITIGFRSTFQSYKQLSINTAISSLKRLLKNIKERKTLYLIFLTIQ